MKNKNFAYALLGLNIVCAWLSWWTLGNSVFERVSEFDWLMPTIAFSCWAVVFTLGAIFIHSRVFFYGSIVLGGAGYAIFNSFNFSLIAVALSAGMLIATEHGVKKELAKGVQLNFYYVVRQSLKYFVTAVCIVVGFSYYFSLDQEDAALGRIGEKSLTQEVNQGLRAAKYIVPEEQKSQIEEILSGVTIDKYLVRDQTQVDINPVLGSEMTLKIDSVGEALNQTIQQESLKKSKEIISKRLDMPIQGDEKVEDIIVRYIDKTQKDFFERSSGLKTYLPIIMALALFLTARILATVVVIFLGFIILLLIKTFRKFDVIGIKKEMKEAAVIEYSI